MFEKLHQDLAPLRQFSMRIMYSIGIGFVFVFLAEAIGMIGYHAFEGMNWIDSFANAAMILSGMGPLTPLKTNAGKIFAGIYALFSGLIFIAIIGIIFAPVVHRFFHNMHIKTK